MTPRHFAWQAWHLVTSIFVSRGKRGTWWHPPAFCVAGVALRALCWLWWRAWEGFSRRWCRGTLRGRRGTWWHPSSFQVASVALGDIHLRFAWQAWRLGHCAGSGGALGGGFSRQWRRGTLRGRHGTGDIHLRFTWQAWHLVTSACVLRGRRGA